MDYDALQLQIIQNKERLDETLLKYETLLDKYGADHDETIRQREQIDELCKKFNILFNKIGNGWSGKMQSSLEEVKERIIEIEKREITREANAEVLNNKIDTVLEKVQKLEERPRNTMLRVKDVFYIILALISIYGGFIVPLFTKAKGM